MEPLGGAQIAPPAGSTGLLVFSRLIRLTERTCSSAWPPIGRKRLAPYVRKLTPQLIGGRAGRDPSPGSGRSVPRGALGRGHEAPATPGLQIVFTHQASNLLVVDDEAAVKPRRCDDSHTPRTRRRRRTWPAATLAGISRAPASSPHVEAGTKRVPALQPLSPGGRFGGRFSPASGWIVLRCAVFGVMKSA
jgi:hypothetical protein